ncbi:2-dehydropantoate 2-reductase [Alteribacter lacisalsi]|uniref:2-dehydropantoate 2-reductase n=1 Tax=Alteribacter lacisalsi TaxID=2045244 RepID=A0A2W0HK83_9BACI|nr:2-dehydropantoate 2-reductase [Alteribacter lacisalsi]PYZ97915.1 2-dehydropantoate 2-reductase [Alteribacter lacisalsi]
MKVHIIGGGAAGLLAAAYAQSAGMDVGIITRTEKQALMLQEEGLSVQHGQEVRKHHVRAESFETASLAGADITIVAVKQFSLSPVLEKLSSMEADGPVLFLMNGMGHLEKGADALPASPLYSGVMTHGAFRVDPVTVRHTGQGILKAGAAGDGYIDEAVYELCTRLDSAGLRCETTGSIADMMAEKLTVNAVINPLTAIYQVENGALCDGGFFEINARELHAEVKSVLPNAAEWDQVEEVIRGTAENYSSMCMDLRKGRPTEVDAITGYVLNAARQKGVKVPLTGFVHHSVKGLERRLAEG